MYSNMVAANAELCHRNAKIFFQKEDDVKKWALIHQKQIKWGWKKFLEKF